MNIEQLAPVIVGTNIQKLGERLANILDCNQFNNIVEYLDAINNELQTKALQRPSETTDNVNNIHGRFDNFESDHDAVIKNAVNKFLGWSLPKDFSPDAGIKFNPEFNVEYMASQGKPPMRHEPVGTNLFSADQAKAMFEYCLSGLFTQPPNTVSLEQYNKLLDAMRWLVGSRDRVGWIGEVIDNLCDYDDEFVIKQVKNLGKAQQEGLQAIAEAERSAK